MYHAIVIEELLKDKNVLKEFKILKTKISGDWHLHILEISDPKIAVSKIQKAMVSDKPYYFHIFNDGKNLIVVFRDKIFHLDPNNQKTWQEAMKYGSEKLNIPEEQLDFFPTRISEEAEWLAGRN